ncbi:MAG TPA: 50S ribosomal protein L9 [Candidatus Paceibacterota bacterium]|jgi:large subunit ribosomal protein L9|nr:50S ribosomal protein L9 [Candidatus Paceibacterota bacterium]
MKVILLKAVQKVGKPEDVVDVSDGYARNVLLRHNLAIPATPDALLKLRQKQSAREADKAARRELLDSAITTIAGQSIVYTVPANEQGNLFSKISAKDIATFLFKQHRIDIDATHILLPDEHIKKLGTYEITVADGEYRGTFTVVVEKE